MNEMLHLSYYNAYATQFVSHSLKAYGQRGVLWLRHKPYSSSCPRPALQYSHIDIIHVDEHIDSLM